VNGDGYADVIVGDGFYSNGQNREGRALVYYGSPSGLSSTPAWIVESNQEDARFGWTVASAGDVNGDGYADVIVAAREYTNGQLGEGAVFVYHGSSAGPGLTPAWTAEGNRESALFGVVMGTAGDVNGDGYSDVIVGDSSLGRALVYQGSANGLSGSPVWIAEGNQSGAQFGSNVATAGDVNGDGYADVMVSERTWTDAGWLGRVFAYHGSANGLSTTPAWTVQSKRVGDYLGGAIGTAGDANSDGYADVVVGVPGYSRNQSGEGAAFVYYGSANGLNTSPAWTAESD
jgi:hypothetical protein